ncbi:transposase [Bradyrhizobium niftali]|uniref:IS110 family transposase n=1 Tax=Bradyrhizobium niftali TaxID=2560055 RepID=A0A4Y9L178_9BRAD|nr:transposase [Bradyrhizobium niftali]TFV37338.1 IS110 family transposase [Bradyrhizobium niftali]
MMTVPGIGPDRSSLRRYHRQPRSLQTFLRLGAYLGLTPRRYQSGEIDRTGRISKRGNQQVGTYLFEAANVLLTVVRRGSALKRRGCKLAPAKVAVARKMAVILDAIWTDGTQFQAEMRAA